jgi:hypothetical protein
MTAAAMTAVVMTAVMTAAAMMAVMMAVVMMAAVIHHHDRTVSFRKWRRGSLAKAQRTQNVGDWPCQPLRHSRESEHYEYIANLTGFVLQSTH